MKARLLFFFLLFCYSSYSQIVINISADKIKGCGRTAIRFDASGSSGYTSFQWNFGNGLSNNTELKPLVMFDPGNYTVTFTANDGQTSLQKSINIIVYKAPVGNIVFDKENRGCTYQTISFKASATAGDAAITQYKWVYGDGEKGIGQNSSHQYQYPNATPGYPLVLEITDGNSCTYKTYVYISISGKPKISIVPNSFYICDSTTVNFSSNIVSDASIQSYKWDFGDGKAATTANPGMHKYDSYQKYKVSLEATDENQCSNRRDTTIAIYNVKADIEVPDSVCTGDTIQFNQKSSDATYFEWVLNDKDTVRTATFKKATTGIDTLLVRLRVGNSYCHSNDNKLIKVSSINAKFNMDTTWVCKFPYDVHFTNQTGNHVKSYEWNFGDGQTSAEKDPKHSFNKASEITLKVTSNAGCTSTAKSSFSLRRPKPVIILSDSGGCLPITVNFIADSSKAISQITDYTWKVSNGGWMSPLERTSITYSKPIIDTVRLTITDKVCGNETAKAVFKGGHKPVVDFQCADTFLITGYNQAINKSQPADSIDEHTWTTSKGIFRDPDLNWKPYIDTAYYDKASSSFLKEKYFPLPGDHVNLKLEEGFYTCTNDKSKTVVMQGPVADIVSVYKTSCQNPTQINLHYKIYDAYRLVYEFENLKGGPGKKDSITFANDVTADNIITVTLTPGYYKLHVTAVNAKNKKRHNITYHEWKTSKKEGDHTCWKADVIIPVANIVKANFVTNKTKACWNEIITLDPSSSENAVLHEWYASSNGTNPQLIYPYYSRSLTEDDPFICQANPEICALSQAYNSLFYRYCPISNSSAQTDSSKTNVMFCNRGIYDIYLISTSVNGCSDTLRKNKLIKVFKPEATLTSNDARVCKGDEITFSLNHVIEDTTITSFKLNFGDGSQHTLSSSGELVKKSYTSGKFYPNIALHDKLGCENQIPHQSLIMGSWKPDFVVTSAPHVTLTTDGVSCKGSQLVVSSDSAFSLYTWNFGDGLPVSNTVNFLNHMYMNPGTYHFSLEVKDSIACTDTISRLIKVVPMPIFKVSVDTPYWGCPIAILGINDIAGNQNVSSRTWELRNTKVPTDMPIIASSASNIVMPIIHPGVYDVSLRINSNYCGSLDSTFHQMFRMNGPYMKMASLKQNYCRSDSILFKPDSATLYNNPIFTLWNFNNKDNGKTLFSNKVVTKQSFDASGNYKVTLFYTDSLGCEMTDTSVTHIYKLKAGFSIPEPICSVPKIIKLTNMSDGYDSLVWKMGNKVSKAIDFIDTLTIFGKYPLSLEVYDTTGCYDIKKWTLAANPKPKGITAKDSIICSGDTIQLKTYYDPAYHYQWSPSTSLGSPSVFQTGAFPRENTRYIVSVRDTSTLCDVEDTINIAVQRIPQILYEYYYLPYGTGKVYEIGAEGAIRIPLGDSIRFHINSDQPNMKYTWENTDNLLSCMKCQYPNVRAMKHAIIRVIPIDSLGCYSKQLQRDFELIPSEGNILMPTAFSPNGDGINDVVKVEGSGLEKLIYFRIFTFTGTQIFETTNLSEGWDGTYHGKPQPAGFYFYKVKVKIYNDTREYEKEGAVKLVK